MKLDIFCPNQNVPFDHSLWFVETKLVVRSVIFVSNLNTIFRCYFCYHALWLIASKRIWCDGKIETTIAYILLLTLMLVTDRKGERYWWQLILSLWTLMVHPTTTLMSKDVEFYCASFELCQKFARGCPPTQTPTQKFKNRFSNPKKLIRVWHTDRFGSQWIPASLFKNTNRFSGPWIPAFQFQNSDQLGIWCSFFPLTRKFLSSNNTVLCKCL